ncbi:uncharacterized protein N7483_012086 [Penicillium malachiteum]|uniref:uncharacterized protein n=1 Tax=Penicillium malachiteum TaxID=1324776 RepID=UPI0025468C3F|nr:uncharacterized protein N7483_012086 [Penicillium malachiteum]KAJ5714905.1 hypothetical protein N7483_012086 [Penicillium malachiteum]
MADFMSALKEFFIDLFSHMVWEWLVIFINLILWAGVYFENAQRHFEDAKQFLADIETNSLTLERYIQKLPSVSLYPCESLEFKKDWDDSQQVVLQYKECANDFIDYILNKCGSTGPNIPYSLGGLKKIIRLNWPGTKSRIRELHRRVENAQSAVNRRWTILDIHNNSLAEMPQVQARRSNDSIIQPLEYVQNEHSEPSVASYKRRLNPFKPLHEKLIESSIIVLQGDAQSGKTQLCRGFAWHHRYSYFKVFWIDAENLNNDTFAQSTSNNGLQDLLQDHRKSITGICNHKKPWLLIVEDASDFGLLEKLLPRSDRGHIIVTTKGLNSSLPPHIHCEKMESLCCAKELLMLGMNLCSPWNDADGNLASEGEPPKKLLPLTLSLVGATINKTKWTTEGYLEKFNQVEDNIPSEYKRFLPATEHAFQRDIIFAFEVSIDEIKERPGKFTQDAPELLAKLAELQGEENKNPVTSDVLRRGFGLLHKKVNKRNRFLSIILSIIGWQSAHGSESEVDSNESAHFDLRMQMAVSKLHDMHMIDIQGCGSNQAFSIPSAALRKWIKGRYCKEPRRVMEV